MFYLIFIVIIVLGVREGLANIKKARKSISNSSEQDINIDSLIWYEIGKETNHD